MRQLLAFIIAAFIAFPALAQDTGFYVGGHLGQAKGKDACDGFAGPGVSCDDKDTSWKLLAGYRFSRNLALEAGYTNLGEMTARGPGGTATRESTAWELVGVGMLPMGNNFSLYGKAGVYRGDTEGRLNTVLLTGTTDDKNTDLTFGAGLQFDMTRNVALRAEWQRYKDMGGDQVGESDMDVLSLGVLVAF